MKAIFTIFKQNKYINIVSIIASCIFYLLLLSLIINMGQSSIETEAIHNFKDKNLYRISDDLYEEKEISFFTDVGSYNKLNNFAKELMSNDEINYYEATWQPIGVANFEGKNFFQAYYEDDSISPPYEKGGESFQTIKALQLNEEAFNVNSVYLSKGRYFNADEYFYDVKDPKLPILLGSDYGGIYQLGDTLKIDYYNKEFKGKVVGFIGANQKVFTNREPELILNKYIILPALIFKEEPSSLIKNDIENKVFYKASLLSRINGFLMSEDSPLEIRQTLNKMSESTNFIQFQVIGANSLAINALISMTEANRTILILTSGLLFLFVMAIYILIASFKTKNNLETYMVFLISGVDIMAIKRVVLYEFLLTLVAGLIIPLILLLLLVENPLLIITDFLFLIGVITSIILVIINKFISRLIKKTNIVQKLKG